MLKWTYFKTIPLKSLSLIGLFLLVLSFESPQICHAQAIVTPEFQAYHSIGTRESTYSSLAGGVGVRLSDQSANPMRRLQLLMVYVSQEVLGIGGKLAGWILSSDGYGLEIGLNDQRPTLKASKGANISLRRVTWDDVHLGTKHGDATQDTLHLGWSAGSMMMAFMGLDFASTQLPRGRILEVQMAVGARVGF